MEQRFTTVVVPAIFHPRLRVAGPGTLRALFRHAEGSFKYAEAPGL